MWMSSTFQREITSCAVNCLRRTPGRMDVERIDLHQVSGTLAAVAGPLADRVGAAQVSAAGQCSAAELL